jgi:hypothetical protein
VTSGSGLATSTGSTTSASTSFTTLTNFTRAFFRDLGIFLDCFDAFIFAFHATDFAALIALSSAAFCALSSLRNSFFNRFSTFPALVAALAVAVASFFCFSSSFFAA